MDLSFASILLGMLAASILYWVAKNSMSFIAQKPNEYKDVGTPFDIRQSLNGEMVCEGVIYGPTGRVVSRFVAEMNAEWNGDEGFMTEKFKYDTGGSLDRSWNLRVKENGQIEATAPDIIGEGSGQQAGSGVQLKYTIQLPESAGGYVLNTTDWMYLMENGTIINRSQMRKFGIKVCELVATIRKANA